MQALLMRASDSPKNNNNSSNSNNINHNNSSNRNHITEGFRITSAILRPVRGTLFYNYARNLGSQMEIGLPSL